jgi:hypothetical protein
LLRRRRARRSFLLLHIKSTSMPLTRRMFQQLIETNRAIPTFLFNLLAAPKKS